MEDELTTDELAFLARQGLGPDDVFDARWMSQADWFEEIKKAGKQVALGGPCKKQSHRLRSRKGHCVQCNTAKLAYAARHNLEQYLYIAGSLQARLIKVGVCKNLLQRNRQICAERHGGAADWEIIYAVNVARAGEIEDRILDQLSPYSVDEHYWKNGSLQKSIELRRCSISQALAVVHAELEGRPFDPAINWRDKSAYEFVPR
ncbi:GIY-YIG nuclease family protein [Bradyrhizobium japonicum]|uniref:GIY-YIG nuclease family protein n=1 Tax=Bradyrhizobium japonicum TaxID=375 RepID=UPI001BA577BD|nr:GIY-YIG nuclease family protein [Bradyrhizobium japonicum]MBR0993960.1 GIY-YIG nuclease family protein [Bradyrhizobium japonicum]